MGARIDAQVLKGHLEPLLLGTLDRCGEAHGYRIIKELRMLSKETFDLPEGTVYPALHRLERDGLIKSRELEVAGRHRRVYRLTTKGNTALGKKRSEFKLFTRGMNSVLEGT